MTEHASPGPRYSLDTETFFTSRRRSRAERRAAGEARRREVPLETLAQVPSQEQRANAIELLHAQDHNRDAKLVPLRYERMGANEFAFLRGAAAVMASDLSKVPTSGLTVQLCGDAHCANFGWFASAERDLVFDLNDFDETLPGPFDWDVRRLATSMALAGHSINASDKKMRKAARAAAWSYRNVMALLSEQDTLAVWNLKFDADFLIGRMGKSDLSEYAKKAVAKSRKADSASASRKLTERVNGQSRFRNDPPLLTRIDEDARDLAIERVSAAYERYLQTLPPDRIALLAHYQFIDIAHKVVGVGSVGTMALVMLLESGDGEPFVMQIKEANASVLEAYLGASQFDHHGRRVVVGQRVMQTSGDPFLGWTTGSADNENRAFYLRQLKDMKGSIDASTLDADSLIEYGELCGAALARAHARVGDRSTIAGYLGETEEFDEAIATFAMDYAKLNAIDYAALTSPSGEA